MLPAIIVGGVYAYYKDSDIVRFFYHEAKMGYWYLFVLSEYYVLMMLLHYLNRCEGKKGLLVVRGTSWMKEWEFYVHINYKGSKYGWRLGII